MNTESIKEKLHLHVKRRLQGNAALENNRRLSEVSSKSIAESQQQTQTSFDSSPSSSAPSTPLVVQGSPQKSRTPRKQTAMTISNAHREPQNRSANEINELAGGDVDPSDINIDSLNNNSIFGGDNFPPISSSLSPSPVRNRLAASLDERCNDVLGEILNQKKAALMQDPMVLKFFEDAQNNLYREPQQKSEK